MIDNAPEYPSIEIERTKLSRLLDRYKEVLGEYAIIDVGDAGFVVEIRKKPPMAGNDWFLFDYDDTLAAYTETKEKRFQLYKTYLEALHIHIPEDIIQEIVEATDKFSRWKESEKGAEMYHVSAHLSALDWATKTLKEISENLQEKEIHYDQEVEKIKSILARIKEQLLGESVPSNEDPFYFDTQKRKLILRNKTPWAQGLGQVFAESMGNPRKYGETIDLIGGLGANEDSIHRINMGIFTYGDPYFQLGKITELLKEKPDLSISQIWLTKVPKGKFIEELVQTHATQRSTMEYVPAELEEDQFEGMSYGSGYPLGKHLHTLVLFDDSPKELDSVLSANPFLAEQTGAQFAVVRSRRSDAKDGKREWEVKNQYGEVDFRSDTVTSMEMIKTLQMNRYLTLKAKLGENSPRVKKLKEEIGL